MALSSVAGVALSLASCSNPESNAESETSASATTVTVTSIAEKSTSASPSSKSSEASSLNLYRHVINNPDEFPVKGDASFVPLGGYSYALVEAAGDELPELLLMVHGQWSSPISVFTIDDGGLVQANGVLIDGAPTGGSQRLRVKGSRSGAGLYQVDHHSLSGQGVSTLFGFADETLYAASGAESYNMASPPADHHEIVWTDTSDASVLESWSGPESIIYGQPQAGSEPNSQLEPSATEDSDIQQFTGVVYEKTAQELMDGGETPNGEPWDELHIVMELDNPRDVTAVNYGTNKITLFVDEVALISDENGYDWSQHVGERITISAAFDHMRFPSDASLPLGALRIFDFTQIE
ncbi:hypothetical protein [Corynebacterium sp. J010B-136]|uniref:hypothetical protein n=1 Tax=Corynebacterium sp. J010B-136 TaxID=2099401 RepID=UPI0011AFD720|nr:hypothetical protein [Corynebacterium sp. J010B-136]